MSGGGHAARAASGRGDPKWADSTRPHPLIALARGHPRTFVQQFIVALGHRAAVEALGLLSVLLLTQYSGA